MSVALPPFIPVQRCAGPSRRPLSIAREVAAALTPGWALLRGGQVALAVGSRAVDRLPEVLGAAVKLLQQGGVQVHIVPAMGSHGGGTCSGRRKVLQDLHRARIPQDPNNGG